MFKAKIKKGDEVVVVAGARRGQRGKVLNVNVETDKPRILIEGVNFCKRHQKKSEAHPNGGIIEREAPLAYSNVMLAAHFDARKPKP